jgi:hypothetical protein
MMREAITGYPSSFGPLQGWRRYTIVATPSSAQSKIIFRSSSRATCCLEMKHAQPCVSECLALSQASPTFTEDALKWRTSVANLAYLHEIMECFGGISYGVN